MDYSEFRFKIGAEPLSSDPALADARAADPALDLLAREAEKFERGLRAAVHFSVPETLLQELLPPTAKARVPARFAGRPRWLALAASLVVVAGVAGLIAYRMGQPVTLEDYVSQHYRHDGAMVLARASESFDLAGVNRILTELGVSAEPALVEQVRYIKFCPSLHGRGSHMVLAYPGGLVTVIFMPDVEVAAPLLVNIDGEAARVIGLDQGAAAIIGAAPTAWPALETLLTQSLTRSPLPAAAPAST